MTAKETVQKIMDYKGLNVAEFASLIGVSTQAIYDMFSGKTANLSPRIKGLIYRNFPEISQDWILKGEGDMIRPPEQPTIVQNISQKHTSGDIHNTASVTTDTTRFLDLLQAKEQSLAKAQDHLTTAQEQITQLIKIIADK